MREQYHTRVRLHSHTAQNKSWYVTVPAEIARKLDLLPGQEVQVILEW